MAVFLAASSVNAVTNTIRDMWTLVRTPLLERQPAHARQRGRRAPGAGATATSNSSSTTTFFLCFDRGGYAISATASSDLNYIDLRNSQRYLTSVMLMPVQNSPGVTMTLPSDVRICEFSIASLLGWLWNERDSESCCEDRPRYHSHHG